MLTIMVGRARLIASNDITKMTATSTMRLPTHHFERSGVTLMVAARGDTGVGAGAGTVGGVETGRVTLSRAMVTGSR